MHIMHEGAFDDEDQIECYMSTLGLGEGVIPFMFHSLQRTSPFIAIDDFSVLP
jgi:hypothetical protein